MVANSSDPAVRYELSMNTVPFAPPQPVVAAVTQAATRANVYPDMLAGELATLVAARLGVPAEQLMFGSGSAALCQLALFSRCSPGDEVVYQWPSFEGYPLMIANARAIAVPVALRATVTDIRDIAAAVTERTRMVVLCNPNNPTGALIEQGDIRRLLELLPDRITVLIDEVYRDFVLDPGYRDGVELITVDPRVLVLRSFSKCYGLAGLRIGYLAGRSELLGELSVLRYFFAPSGPAQAAAIAALGRESDVDRRRADIGTERTRLRAMLRRQGWQVPVSHANFLWLATNRASALTRHCADAGIAVREWPERGVRVTIGDPVANDAFAELAAEFLAGERS